MIEDWPRRMAGRIGGALLVASLVVGGLVGLVGLATTVLGEIAVLLLAGVGALLVAFDAPTSLDRRLLRVSLGGVGVGALLVGGAYIRGGMVTGDAMGDFLAMSLLLVGAVVLLAGLLGTIAALAARRSALGGGAAIAIVAGLVACLMTAWVSEALAIVGLALVLCGLAAIGLIALGFGSPYRGTV